MSRKSSLLVRHPIAGDGTLTINGNAKNGIKGGDDSSIVIDGGLTVDITAANDGINTNYDLAILNGNITINAVNDGIHADHILTIGGEDTQKLNVTITSNHYLLLYVLTDGSEKEISWKHKSRSKSWTDEMRQAARERALKRHGNLHTFDPECEILSSDLIQTHFCEHRLKSLKIKHFSRAAQFFNARNDSGCRQVPAFLPARFLAGCTF